MENVERVCLSDVGESGRASMCKGWVVKIIIGRNARDEIWVRVEREDRLRKGGTNVLTSDKHVF